MASNTHLLFLLTAQNWISYNSALSEFSLWFNKLKIQKTFYLNKQINRLNVHGPDVLTCFVFLLWVLVKKMKAGVIRGVKSLSC